ncbi:hypothetical protein HMI54_005899 [Coelomomyces lativittatus]|nr:hypothetical protein HMI54_005899 [Coelomomyces lativittatus]
MSTLPTTTPTPSSSSSSSDGVPLDPRFGPSKAWLLRLFKSEFFNEWLAIYYLFKYPDHLGT